MKKSYIFYKNNFFGRFLPTLCVSHYMIGFVTHISSYLHLTIKNETRVSVLQILSLSVIHPV